MLPWTTAPMACLKMGKLFMRMHWYISTFQCMRKHWNVLMYDFSSAHKCCVQKDKLPCFLCLNPLRAQDSAWGVKGHHLRNSSLNLSQVSLSTRLNPALNVVSEKQRWQISVSTPHCLWRRPVVGLLTTIHVPVRGVSFACDCFHMNIYTVAWWHITTAVNTGMFRGLRYLHALA